MISTEKRETEKRQICYNNEFFKASWDRRKRQTEKAQIYRLGLFRIADNIFYAEIETSGKLEFWREMQFSRNRPDAMISILGAYHIAKYNWEYSCHLYFSQSAS